MKAYLKIMAMPYVDLSNSVLEFEGTIFDKLPIPVGDALEWFHLSDFPIHGSEVVELAHAFITVVDRRHGYRISSERGKRCYGCLSEVCNWKLTFKRTVSRYTDYKNQPWTLQQKSPSHGLLCHGDHLVLSKDVLRNLPELAQLLFESNGSTQITKRHVVNHLLSHKWDIRLMHRSSVYATLSDLRSKIREHTAQEYTKFPQFLRRFIQLNPTASGAYQKDDDGCFYRLFVSIPNGPKIFAQSCLPLYFIDGGFPKSNEYDGVYVVFMGRNGAGANILLGFASVPDENCNHMSWVLLMLLRAGYDLTGYPIFTDRGNILLAARALEKRFGIVLSLKLCLEHLLRNMVKKFKVKGDSDIKNLRNRFCDIQGASYLHRKWLFTCC
jgi:hypothetical protein